MRPRRPRLAPALYVGFQRVFLTFCTDSRQPFFTRADVVALAKEQILHAATESHEAILAYCFMPDHLHLLIEGEDEASDALKFAHQAKQRSAFVFSRRFNRKLWQPSFNDHVLRDDEATLSVARYIVENPSRARLVQSPQDYPFAGSSKYSIDQILDAACWQP